MAVTVALPSVHPEALGSLSRTVQPLIFDTGIADCLYSTSGTVFLVGYKGKTYVVTTRHGFHPDHPPAICIFASDTSDRFVPLKNVFYVAVADEPEDFVDLAIIEVDRAAATDPEFGQLTMLDLDQAVEADWESGASQLEFFAIGYPSERSNIDFSTQEIRTDQVTLFGRYVGESNVAHLHLLQVNDPAGLTSFSGMSGSPIFMWRPSKDGRQRPVLCGMAIRGTVDSGLIHFLPISILLGALSVKRKQHEDDVDR